jgi:hypothetical protein
LADLGGWHIVDSVLSHWLMAIHRIKVDSPNPLAWDLAWLVGFGLVPVTLACWLHRRNGGDGTALLSRPRLVAILISSVAAGGRALRGPPDGGTLTVVFRDARGPSCKTRKF